MAHNPGGVFNNWRGQSYPMPTYRRPDPYAYGYSSPGSTPKTHKVHTPGNTCWCGYNEKRKRVVMSQAIWCDWGDHAFSSNDPDRHRLSETKMEKDPEYRDNQREVTTVVDVCGPCWSTGNPFRKDADKTAIPQDESYLQGYRDGVIKGETIQ